MTRGSAADFLIRVVLDEAFRELAMADPQRAFEGYNLSDSERGILSGRDERLLELLGRAVAPGRASDAHREARDSSKAAARPLPTLPEVKLVLRLAPHTPQPAEATPQAAYEASLQPWLAEHATGQCGAAPAGLAWLVRITPTVVDSQEAGLTVAYSASIHPLAAGAGDSGPLNQQPARAPASPPWNHHIESSAAKEAALAVRASDARGRYEKLLDLIHALQTGDDRG